MINERDYAAYCELYEAVISFMPPPDLIVYLRADVETLQERIAQRGRDFEQRITPDYLQQLNDLYDSWITNFQLCPVLTIPADHINFIDSEEHLRTIATYILDRLQGKDVLVLE
jgi:deoxyadenosine/deoxycytidine kinase